MRIRPAIVSRFVVVLLAFASTGTAAFSQSLPGIDVSKWQGTINWTSVKNSGVVFAFCKATQGTTYVDPNFATNWAQMKSKGIIRGAYHYAEPGSDATAQALHFVNTVKPQSGDLPLVLDLENTGGLTPTQLWTWTKKFCENVRQLTRREPIIYTGFYFWRDSVGNPTNNLKCPLWMERWGTTPMPLPAAWSKWTFWQYSSTGTTPGISGDVDQDYFNGSLADLQKLAFPAQK